MPADTLATPGATPFNGSAHETAGLAVPGAPDGLNNRPTQWIAVGIDGTGRGEKALAWAARRASRTGSGLALICVVSPKAQTRSASEEDKITWMDEIRAQADEDARNAGVLEADPAPVAAPTPLAIDMAQGILERLATEVRAILPEECPVRTQLLEGDVVTMLAGIAPEYSLLVMGSHHGRTMSDVVGGARGYRLSVATSTPVAVIPHDWDPVPVTNGIVVGVGHDDSAEAALAFGVEESLHTGKPLEIISSWGLPAALSKPAELMGGGVSPVGDVLAGNLTDLCSQLQQQHPGLTVSARPVEGPSPAKVLMDCAAGKSMLVIGSHGRSTLGRILFGSVGNAATAQMSVPVIIVPKA